MQGKLIAVVHIETSSFWAEFVNKNRCISVRLVSEEVKSIKFDNFDNSQNSFLWLEYFIDFFMWKMDPMSGCDTAVTSALCLLVYSDIFNVLQDRIKDELTQLLLFTLVYLYIVLQDRFKDDPSLLLMFTMISKFFLDELNLTWTNTEEIHHIVGKNIVLFYIFLINLISFTIKFFISE